MSSQRIEFQLANLGHWQKQMPWIVVQGAKSKMEVELSRAFVDGVHFNGSNERKQARSLPTEPVNFSAS